ncbi:MAG: hypothetical protein AB7S26_10840 [Sandaracinaceae bacterium]
MNEWLNKARLARALVVCGTALVGLAGCGGEGVGESVVPNLEAIVFTGVAFENADFSHNVTHGMGQTIDYDGYVPGGGVYVLSPPTPDGELRNLTEEFEGVDVNGLDVSFDATRVLFSMRTADSRTYNIYEANIDGSGVRQLTFTDVNKFNPIYVPGNRVAFNTAEPYTEMGVRANEYTHGRNVSQIAIMDLDAGEASTLLCSQNLSNTVRPFLLSTGEIGYSRWEHLGPVNDVKLFRMAPDCTNMVAIAGQHGKPGNSLVQAQEVPGRPGEFTSIVTSREGTIQAGALLRIDSRAHDAADPSLVIDEQASEFVNLTPDVPTGMGSPPSGVGRYRDPRSIRDITGNDDHYLVSWADGDVNERNELAETAPNFGIYLFDAQSGQRTLVFDNPNQWELYAQPVRPREEPPVIGSLIDRPAATEPAILGSIDITQTSLTEGIGGAQFDGTPLGQALQQATRVRIIEGFSSEIGAVREFGLTMHEGAAILGETPVQADGSWRAAVPAYLPYHLQPIDRFGLSIRNQLLWIQAMPGETRSCGGCHAARAEVVQPRNGPQTIAQQIGPDMSTNVQAIADRLELPWAGSTTSENIQDVLDRNCVSCHDGGGADPYAGRSYHVEVTTMEGEMLEYDIPYLLLTDEPIEVYYENELVAYPASYVTLLYPSAMMGDSMATGDVPPQWVIPGAARESRLNEVVNVTAENDPTELAWASRPLHPENVGGAAVTRDDRMSLIRMSDLGGQYYSRRNVTGAPGY